MLEQFGKLWELLTIFFNAAFVSDPLISGLLVFSTIFGLIYICIWFFDGGFVKW